MTPPSTPFPLLDPATRHEVHLVISAHLSNPNGDLDAGNAPRVNPFTGHGIISAASIKRKARDYVAAVYDGEPGMALFIRHGEALSTAVHQALAEAGVPAGPTTTLAPEDLAVLMDFDLPDAFQITEVGTVTYDGTLKGKDLRALTDRLIQSGVPAALVAQLTALTGKKPAGPGRRTMQDQARPVLVTRYWDARVFGYTAPDSAGKLRGPVQVTDAESTHPVNLVEQVLTRVARSQPGEKEGANIIRRTVVDHAVYVATVHINPYRTHGGAVTSRDLQVLLEGLWHGQALARSSTRPDVRVQALVIVSHATALGNAPAHTLARRLNVTHDGAYDVQVTFDTHDLPAGVTVHLVQA